MRRKKKKKKKRKRKLGFRKGSRKDVEKTKSVVLASFHSPKVIIKLSFR